MDNFKCLEEFKASRNRIAILPDSIVDIENLKILWLDNNQLSSLPVNFHRLLNLTTLKMDGNVDLIYPSLETVLEGVGSVLTWSRNRLAMKHTKKVRDIAQAIVEVLKQTREYQLGGDLQHDSLLEVLDDGQYQFAPEALWLIFLPELKKIWCDPVNKSTQQGIKSFPYERSEAENALFQYRDAAGPIVRQIKNASFRNCSCVQTGRAQVTCATHDKEWKCSRPALILRPNCVYEDNMVEKRRQEKDKKQLDHAQRTARENAKAYLSSDDGIIFVREEAEKRLDAGFCANSDKRQEEPAQGPSLPPIPTQICQHISYRLHKIKGQLGGKRRAQLGHLEKQVRDEYIACEVLKRTKEVEECQEKVKVVLGNWMGLTISDFFSGWRSVLNEGKQGRLKFDRQVLRDQQLQYQDDLAKYELALISVSHPPTIGDLPCTCM